VGEQLRIKQFSCECDRHAGSKGQGGMGNDQDDTVVVPLHTLQRRVTGTRKVGTCWCRWRTAATAPLKASLRQLLRERRKLAEGDDDNFNVLRHPADWPSAVGHHQGADHAARRGGGRQPAGGRHRHHEHHAGERHRAHARDRPAPGHRRARSEVLLQFLIEAVVLSALGGLIGIASRRRHPTHWRA
jgi:putative ABC transport system permease protein